MSRLVLSEELRELSVRRALALIEASGAQEDLSVETIVSISVDLTCAVLIRRASLHFAAPDYDREVAS